MLYDKNNTYNKKMSKAVIVSKTFYKPFEFIIEFIIEFIEFIEFELQLSSKNFNLNVKTQKFVFFDVANF